MRVLFILLALGPLVIGGLDAFQAVTGRRLSKRPSTRDDATMRRQSAIAALLLLPMGLFVLAIALLA